MSGRPSASSIWADIAVHCARCDSASCRQLIIRRPFACNSGKAQPDPLRCSAQHEVPMMRAAINNEIRGPKCRWPNAPQR